MRRYPVLLTLCHMAMCTAMAAAVAKLGITPYVPLKSRAQLGKVAALALVFCLAIVLASLSLRYIPVSFNQVRWLQPQTAGLAPPMISFLEPTLQSDHRR